MPIASTAQAFVRDAVRHIERCFFANSLSAADLATEEEKALLKLRGIETMGPRNLLCWRKSTLIVTMVPNIGIFAFSLLEMLRLLAKAEAVAALTANGNVAARRAAGEPFMSYSNRFAAHSATTLEADTLGPQATIYACITAMCACTVLCNGAAVYCWDRYVLSRRAVLAGWFCLFAAPFLLSIVPLNMFISWSKLPRLVDTYTAEFLRRFDPEPLFEVLAAAHSLTSSASRSSTDSQLTP